MKVGGKRTLIIPPRHGLRRARRRRRDPAERDADLRRRAARSEIGPYDRCCRATAARRVQAARRLPAAGVPGRRARARVRPRSRRRRASRRRSRSAAIPAPAPPKSRAPLVLDGEQQADVDGRARRRRAAAPRDTRSTTAALTILDPPAAGTLTVRSRIAPGAQRRARRPLRLVGRVLHAVRARGLPPHHLLSRPARRAGALHGDDRAPTARAIRCCCPTATCVDAGRARPTAATSRRGTTRFRSRRTCSRWSRATSPRSTTRSPRVAAATCALRDLLDAATTCRAAATRWRRSSARCAGTRSASAASTTSTRFMIFCADDFNMGAMENKGLNIFNSRLVLADPDTATDDDYQRDRGRGRPRVLPQLDRQPRHLPRLVPAVAEGRPHGVPRPGVLERHGLARGRAHRRRRVPAARAVPRGRGPDGASGAAGRVPWRSTISTRRPSTKRAPKSSACSTRCSAPKRFRRGMDLYFERHDGQAVTCDDFVQAMQDAVGRRPHAVPPLVRAGRHAGRRVARQLRRRARAPTRSTSRSTPPPTPGQPRQAAVPHSARRGPGRPRRPRPAAAASTARPRRAARRACSTSREPRQSFRFVDVAARAGAVAAARLLGAGARVEFDYTRRRARVPRRARQRPGQPLGRRAAQLRRRDPARSPRDHREGRAAGAAGRRSSTLAGHLLADRDSDPALLALALTPPDAALRRRARAR